MQSRARPGRFVARCVLGALACTLAVGCGRGGEKLVPVAGKVTVSGSPLTSGSVTFRPDAAKGSTTKHLPVGTIDGQGHYQLQSADRLGAPLGWYKVTVTAQAPIDPQNPYAPPKHLINPKFSDPNTSGLSVEVVAGAAPGAYDFQVSK